MRLTEISYGTALAIESYGPGFFRVGSHVLRGPSLIAPWGAGAWGGLADSAAILALAGGSTCCFWALAATWRQCRRRSAPRLRQRGSG